MRENQSPSELPFESTAAQQQSDASAKEAETTPNPEQKIACLRTSFDALEERYDVDIGQLTGDLHKDHVLEMQVAPDYIPRIVELIQTAQEALANYGTPATARALTDIIHDSGLYGVYRHNDSIMAAYVEFHETVETVGIDPKPEGKSLGVEKSQKADQSADDREVDWDIPETNYLTIDGRPYSLNFTLKDQRRDWNWGKSF